MGRFVISSNRWGFYKKTHSLCGVFDQSSNFSGLQAFDYLIATTEPIRATERLAQRFSLVIWTQAEITCEQAFKWGMGKEKNWRARKVEHSLGASSKEQ